jgi:hypothetical protein
MYDLHHMSSKAWNADKMLCLGGLGGLHGDNIFKKRGWEWFFGQKPGGKRGKRKGNREGGGKFARG